MVVGPIGAYGIADAFVVHAEITPDGDRRSDVEAVVVPFEVVLHAVGQRGRVTLRSQRFAFGRHGHQDRVVGRNENAPSGPGEPVVQLAFPAPDTLRAAETFQVGSSDVGDDAVVGFRDRAEQGDLPARARTHLHDAELHVAGHRQQGQRYADVVVQVAPGGIDFVLLGQHAADQLLRGGFAVAARDGEDRQPQLPAVFPGEGLQGLQCVVHDDQTVCLVGAGVRERGIVHDGVCRPLFEGVGCEAVAVERRPPEREEYGIGLDAAGVRRNARVAQIQFIQG